MNSEQLSLFEEARVDQPLSKSLSSTRTRKPIKKKVTPVPKELLDDVILKLEDYRVFQNTLNNLVEQRKKKLYLSGNLVDINSKIEKTEAYLEFIKKAIDYLPHRQRQIIQLKYLCEEKDVEADKDIMKRVGIYNDHFRNERNNAIWTLAKLLGIGV